MPSTKPEHPLEQRRTLRRAFIASLMGTSLEWYDFALYGASAAVVFSQLFFSNDDPAMATIKAFLTYAAGYISRPIGGVVFGRLGDRVGRKKVLMWTLMLIGGSTVCIGLLPTYATVGVWAPIALVVLRFLQGVGVGGEWGGAVLLSSEFGDPNERGFWASAAQIGVPLGSVLANLVLLILSSALSKSAFLSWGWRLAFMLAGVIVAFGIWLRLRLEETPVFKRLAERNEVPEAPVMDVLRTQRRALTGAVLSRVGPDVAYAFFAVFVLVWLKSGPHALSSNEALACTLVGGAFQVVTMPVAGWLSDRVDRRMLYAGGAIGGAIWMYVFIALTQTRSFAMGLAGVVIGLFFHSIMYAPQAAHVAEQFHARLRYTGSSLAYTIAGIIGGGFAPSAFAWLNSKNSGGYLIAAYVTIAVVITLIGLAMGKRVVDEVDQNVIDPRLTPSHV
ncbi:MAG TPA: MFS transporter [Flexivirga sp.]|uniref:MFS transporter n=1 Tax=Flexivirga sp. TaxID=1962927 RepID=UPI002CA1CA5A|nr:MFS transporter [Flexivirga sp.]HWC24043.1 MFS transporter [Flexivirga sp.]